MDTTKLKMDTTKLTEHLDYLDKYYQDIAEYLESGKTINFNRKGHDYVLVRFFEKEMKFEARRKEDDKMGKLPVTSYEVEDIYHKLFKNQKNQNEEKITMKTTKKMKKTDTEENEKIEPVTKSIEENVDKNGNSKKSTKKVISEKPLSCRKFINQAAGKTKSIEKIAKQVEDAGYTFNQSFISYVKFINWKDKLGLS